MLRFLFRRRRTNVPVMRRADAETSLRLWLHSSNVARGVPAA